MACQEESEPEACGNFFQHSKLPGEDGDVALPAALTFTSVITKELHWCSITICYVVKKLAKFDPLYPIKVPPSAGRLSKRLVKNVDYFQVWK